MILLAIDIIYMSIANYARSLFFDKYFLYQKILIRM